MKITIEKRDTVTCELCSDTIRNENNPIVMVEISSEMYDEGDIMLAVAHIHCIIGLSNSLLYEAKKNAPTNLP